MEAVLKPAPKPAREQRRNPFEGVDLREAGRRGGKERWRKAQLEKELEPLRRQDALEQKIFDGNNRAAQEALLRRWEKRNRALEAKRHDLDDTVVRLTERKDVLAEQCVELAERLRELDDQALVLEQRKAAASSIDDDTLVVMLRDVGEQRIERALRELDWLDDEDDVDAA